MSHFTVVVCVKHPDDLEQALAPFDENREVEPYRRYEEGAPGGYWAVRSLREHEGLNPDDVTLTWAQVAEAANRRYPEESPLLLDDDSGRAYTMSTWNPQAKWDWWVTGGRWPGRFIFRQECAGQVLKPKPHWGAPDEAVPPLHCDGAPKSALDLAALREEAAARARKTCAEWHAATAGTPIALPWSAFADNISPDGYTVEQAREEYHSQPRVKALEETDFRWYDDAIAEFQVPEPLYVERQRAQAVPGWATLTLDGRWMEQGRMGWFGANDATDGSRIGYWEAANAYIGELPGDVWLIAVDCHI